MQKVIYHEVEFRSPGTFFPECSHRKIDEWNTKTALKIAKEIIERYNSKPYGFRFLTYENLEDLPEGFESMPKEINRSGMFYFNGKIRTSEEILSGTNDEERILRSNVKNNNIKYIVQSIDPDNWTWAQPFKENDTLIDLDGNILFRMYQNDKWMKEEF